MFTSVQNIYSTIYINIIINLLSIIYLHYLIFIEKKSTQICYIINNYIYEVAEFHGILISHNLSYIIKVKQAILFQWFIHL